MCLDVHATVGLLAEDGLDKVVTDFELALNTALAESRLQGFLNEVNPSTRVIMYKGDLPPTNMPTVTESESIAPSNAPSDGIVSPTGFPTTRFSTSSPTFSETLSSSLRPSEAPSMRIQTQAPSLSSAPSLIDSEFSSFPIAASPTPSVSVFPSETPQTNFTASPTAEAFCDSLNTLLDGAAPQQVPALVFDLNAISDITVNEISLHLNNEVDLVVEIWTKEGTWSLDGVYPYVGTAWDRTGWTQIKRIESVTGKGPSQLTNIGAFDTPVTLAAGSVQSFYIWTNSGSALVKDIITNSDVQASTSDLSIERAAGFYVKSESEPSEGSISIWGNGYEFEGTIDYCIAGGSSEPTSCNAVDPLSTLLDGAAPQQVPALVFDMTVLSDITVKEISLHLKAESDLVVEIWTKEGTWSLDGVYPYVGTAWDRTGWTQIKSVVGVTGSGASQLTTIGAFDTPVTLTAGSIQSFYIWTNSGSALIKDIITNSDVQALTSDLSIGRVAGFYIKSDSDPVTDAVSIWGNGYEFEGTIEYCLSPGNNCGTLDTLLDGAAPQQVPALLFDMTALSDITVNEISLHLKAENDLVVEIWTKEGTWSLDGAYPYVGTAFDRTGWTQVKSVVGVTGKGPSQLTTISAFDTPVALAAGSVQSFYIWTSSNTAIIKDIITNSDVQASTSDLSIERVAGFYIKSKSEPATGSFSLWGNGYELEGSVEYC